MGANGAKSNGHAVLDAEPVEAPGELSLPPEVQGLLIEAMFWRQKYFELREHTNQVIEMLGRPPAAPEQVANMLQRIPAGQ